MMSSSCFCSVEIRSIVERIFFSGFRFFNDLGRVSQGRPIVVVVDMAVVVPVVVVVVVKEEVGGIVIVAMVVVGVSCLPAPLLLSVRLFPPVVPQFPRRSSSFLREK